MVREDDMGVQIRPLVCRIMNAIFSVVMSDAAIIRSPSFSREVLSKTVMNSPRSDLGMVSLVEIGSGGDGLTECIDCVFDAVNA